METNTIIWISLVLAWVVLFCLNLQAFFFQRTIHKIHMKTGLPTNAFNGAVPTYYSVINLISMLRWIVLIILFFYNWIAGVICLVIEFVLPQILPEEDDYKNMWKMRKQIANDPLLKPIDDLLKEFMETM